MQVWLQQERRRDNFFFGIVKGPSDITVTYRYDPNSKDKSVFWGVSITKLPFEEQDLLSRLVRTFHDPVTSSAPPVKEEG